MHIDIPVMFLPFDDIFLNVNFNISGMGALNSVNVLISFIYWMVKSPQKQDHKQ